MNGFVANTLMWLSLTSPIADMPPASDLLRFPSRQVCDNQLAFLAHRRAWLEGQRGLYADPMYQPWFEVALDDVDNRHNLWESLYEAHGWATSSGRDEEGDLRRDYLPETRSRMVQRRLSELKEALGDRDYSNGTMPIPIAPEFWWR